MKPTFLKFLTDGVFNKVLLVILSIFLVAGIVLLCKGNVWEGITGISVSVIVNIINIAMSYKSYKDKIF